VKRRQGASRSLYPSPEEILLWIPVCNGADLKSLGFSARSLKNKKAISRAQRKRENAGRESKLSPTGIFSRFSGCKASGWRHIYQPARDR